VRLAALVVLALAAPAAAERPVAPAELAVEPPVPRPAPSYTRLGTRVSYASVPLDQVQMSSYALGLSLDRPVLGGLRLVGEYDYVWLGPLDGIEQGVAGLPASGHRLQAAVRHTLGRAALSPLFQIFLDVDAGAGASIIDDPMRGVIAPVHAFAGVHAGMTLVQADRQAIWDYDLLLRIHASADGIGAFLGVGMSWGE